MNDFNNRKQAHAPFETAVVEHLETCGFVVGTTAYHDTLSPKLCDLLKGRDRPTSEHVRNAPDLIAVHRDLPLEFYVEVKTHTSQRYHDLTFEARQLVERIAEAEREIMCLYCYCDPDVRECGFWSFHLPPIRDIRLPERWQGHDRLRLQKDFARYLPGVPVVDARNSTSPGASNTPFAVIAEAELAGLDDWRDLIKDAMIDANDS